MRSTKIIHVVSCHAEGEVGDVIVGGVAPPPGDSVWDQRKWIAEDETLRNFMLNEPRGGVFRHVNLLVPPKHPEAQAAWIIMEPEDTPPMSGSNSICVSTVLLDSGILPMTEPVTEMVLEAPGGLVRVRAECANGKAERIYVENLPSFASRLDIPLTVPGLGEITVDTAFGGDSFVVVDPVALGVDLKAENAREIAELGIRITNAANAQFRFEHPEKPDWAHHSFCLFAGPITREPFVKPMKNNACSHSYSRHAITHLLKRKKDIPCPVAGCQQRVSKGSLVADAEREEAMAGAKRKQERAAKRAQDKKKRKRQKVEMDDDSDDDD